MGPKGELEGIKGVESREKGFSSEMDYVKSSTAETK